MPPIEKADEEMESWEVFRRIIPRGKSAVFARFLHVSPDYVRRWCLPTPEDNEDGTGFRNPLDKICECVDAAFIADPLKAALIPEFVSEHYRQLVRRHERAGFGGSAERRDAGAELLKSAVAAVNSLNIEGATDNTLADLVDLIEACVRNKEKVQAEMATRGVSEAQPSGRATVATMHPKQGGSR